MTKHATPLVRFPPSPTGHLHIGNLRTALINYAFAKKSGGRFMLRFDDTDTDRSLPEYMDSIRHDLSWMGLDWGEAGEVRQSSRTAVYEKGMAKLMADRRIYPCFETAEELALMRKSQLASGKPPVYNRAALKLSADEVAAKQAGGHSPHYRFLLDGADVAWDDMVRGAQTIKMTSLSDPVVRRADGRFIYTLASVIDDAEFGITHILRGEDHTTNSAVQLQMFTALDARPPVLGHFPLLVAASGEVLSKRLGSLTIGQLRDRGIEAEVLASVLLRLGTDVSVTEGVARNLDQLIEAFDVGRYHRAPSRIGDEMLDLLGRLNAQLLAGMDWGEAKQRLGTTKLDAPIWQAVRDNCKTLAEAEEWATIIQASQATAGLADKSLLAAAVAALPKLPVADDGWQVWTDAIMAATGLGKKQVYGPLRLALTGRAAGPAMAKLLPLLAQHIGRDGLLARLGKTGNKEAVA